MMDLKTLKKKRSELESKKAQLEADLYRVNEDIRRYNLIEGKARSSSYQKQRAIEKELVAPWVKENVKPGDLIKVKGSRNKSVRSVVKLQYGTVVTQCMNETKSGNFTPAYIITDHGFDKVTHVLRHAKWLKIKDLVK